MEGCSTFCRMHSLLICLSYGRRPRLRQGMACLFLHTTYWMEQCTSLLHCMTSFTADLYAMNSKKFDMNLKIEPTMCACCRNEVLSKSKRPWHSWQRISAQSVGQQSRTLTCMIDWCPLKLDSKRNFRQIRKHTFDQTTSFRPSCRASTSSRAYGMSGLIEWH